MICWVILVGLHDTHSFHKTKLLQKLAHLNVRNIKGTKKPGQCLNFVLGTHKLNRQQLNASTVARVFYGLVGWFCFNSPTLEEIGCISSEGTEILLAVATLLCPGRSQHTSWEHWTRLSSCYNLESPVHLNNCARTFITTWKGTDFLPKSILNLHSL